jgi:hypothetical protein
MSVTDPKFNPSGSAAIDAIKNAGVAMEAVIRENTPVGRRQSLALTNLETALMFAVKSAAVGD